MLGFQSFLGDEVGLGLPGEGAFKVLVLAFSL